MKFNERALCRHANGLHCDLEGFIHKRADNNKHFYRRYFKLKGNLLFYFDHRGASQPLGVIVLEGCHIIQKLIDQDLQHPFCIEIVFDFARTYVLSFESLENMQVWIKKLRCAGSEYKNRLIAELQQKLEGYENNLNALQISQPTPMMVTHELRESITGIQFAMQNESPKMIPMPQSKALNYADPTRKVGLKSKFFCDLPQTHATRNCDKKSADDCQLQQIVRQAPTAPNFEEMHEVYRKELHKDFERYHLNRRSKSKVKIIRNLFN